MDQTYLTTLIAIAMARATERILLVLVGAMAVYLGYSLFRNIPNATRGAHLGEGKIELPGGISIFMTRIGPGVFFALFGIAVIGYSVTKPVQFNFPAAPTAAAGTVTAGTVVNYSGLGERDTPPGLRLPPAPMVSDPGVVIAKLNGAYQEAQKRLTTPAAAELADAIRAAKFAVMLVNWKPEWGDRAKFERWVREHGDKDPPPDLVPGATATFASALP
jgi:branched-subunit amino acid transport protein